MSLGSMTSARVLMGLLAAVVAVSLVWLLPVGVLGTSTRVLADDTNQAEADPLLGISVLTNQLVGALPGEPGLVPVWIRRLGRRYHHRDLYQFRHPSAILVRDWSHRCERCCSG